MARRRSTEERVVAGASRAIERHGWRAATLTQIAEEAGLSRMTLHRHGLGRSEIFGLLAEAYERDFRDSLWPAMLSHGSGLERLQAALVAVCDVTERHLAFLAGLDDEADSQLFHESAGGVRSRDAYVSPLERLLEDGIADGSIRQLDVPETATLVVNTVDRTYRHLRATHAWSVERTREPLIDLVLRGLVAVPGDG
jgi:AcrR family transcriptional regulator